MKVIIEAPFTIGEEMDKDIQGKISNLAKYEDKISQANVSFKLNDGKIPNAVLAQIRLHIPGNDLFASESAEQAMGAFHLCANQIKTQLLKRKDINKDHR